MFHYMFYLGYFSMLCACKMNRAKSLHIHKCWGIDIYISIYAKHKIHTQIPGYYCPLNTGADLQPCPSGTYNQRPGIHNVTECTQCDGGTYCLTPGLSAPSGNCSAGYYCRYGEHSHCVSLYTVLILDN